MPSLLSPSLVGERGLGVCGESGTESSLPLTVIWSTGVESNFVGSHKGSSHFASKATQQPAPAVVVVMHGWRLGRSLSSPSQQQDAGRPSCAARDSLSHPALFSALCCTV